MLSLYPPLLPLLREKSIAPYPKNLAEAILLYEKVISRPQLYVRKTIWQTWRESHLSDAMEAKWSSLLIQNPTFDRRVVTDLYASFLTVFHDDGRYFNRTVARLVPGAAKADVWRYATLYHHGGVYIDADSMIVERSLAQWLQRDSIVPILSNEGHWWKRQYVPRCKSIWEAANLTLPEHYERSVLQWALVFPYPRHPILWQTLQLVDQLIEAAPLWEDKAALADKVLCVTGPAVFTVAVHMVVESHPQSMIDWEGIDYNGKVVFKDSAAPVDDLHYQKHRASNSRLIQ